MVSDPRRNELVGQIMAERDLAKYHTGMAEAGVTSAFTKDQHLAFATVHLLRALSLQLELTAGKEMAW